jgi:hypothetical protein
VAEKFFRLISPPLRQPSILGRLPEVREACHANPLEDTWGTSSPHYINDFRKWSMMKWYQKYTFVIMEKRIGIRGQTSHGKK